MNDELNNKFKVSSDEIKNEINMLRDEGERRRQHIESAIRENKGLDEKLIHLTSERRSLESDLHSLTKKHEYTVNDYNTTIQRLEEDNMNLLKQKEELDNKLNQKNTDLRNLNYDMKYHRDETNKKEATLQENITKNDAELYREREMYKKLSNS